MHSPITLAGLVGVAAVAVHALPQAPAQSDCTFTATPCAPFRSGPTETITVYEEPFAQTSTATFVCGTCQHVTVEPKNCFGLGLPVTTTEFVYTNAQTTTTVDVCAESTASV